MLQNLGDVLKSHAWLKYLLLGLLIAVFALWGAYGLVDVTVGTPSYGLKVNGEEIPATTLQQQWQERLSQMQQQFKGELPPELRERLQDQFINETVRETLMRQRASEGGFRVGDEAVAEAYEAEKAFQVEGKFSKEAAQAVLAQVGMSPVLYEQQLRETLQINQLQRSLALGDFVTEGEFKRSAALENEQREVRWVLLPAARYAAAARVDEAAIKAWYDAHQADYLTPESVRLQYAELRLDTIAAAVTVTDADLKAWYDLNQSKYVEPEKRRARHILIPDDADAQKKLAQVQAELKAGADFSALARKYSVDTGSAKLGGDLGFALRTAFVKEFADKLFALKVGEVSEPVKTQFGYHIIKLDAVQGGQAVSLADNRARIEADYRRDRAADLYGDRQERLQQKLETGAGDFASLVQEFGLVTGEIPDYSRGNGGALGSSPDIASLVFSDRVIKDQRIGGPIALGDDRMLIVKALDHRQPKARPIAEVHATIEAAIRKEEGSKAANAAAADAVKRLKAGEALDVVAKSLGVAATPVALLGRGDPQPPAQVRDAAFSAPVPTAGKASYQSLAMEEGGAAVVAVLSVKPGALGGNPTADQRLMSSVNQQQTAADLAAYLAEAARRAKIAKNPAIFQ
jgi:peptidyl-prolyl cis-trans isomerase D